MYLQERSLLEGRNSFANNESIEGLERQIMEAVESPKRQSEMIDVTEVADDRQKVQGFPFDSRDDSFTAQLFGSGMEDDGDQKMYDLIISKVLSNPRIDKRTLL